MKKQSYVANETNVANEKRGSVKRRRFKRRYLLLGSLFLLLAILAIGVPFAASNRSWVVYSINRYAGLAPLQVDLDRISVSWFEPIHIHGLRVTDAEGVRLLQVGEVTTSKGLMGFARNRQDIGTITLKELVIDAEVQPGTTNLEQAMAPLLNRPASTTTSSPLPTGTIVLDQCQIRLRDAVELQAWTCAIERAEVPLPSLTQPLPPLTLLGSIQQESTAPSDNSGIARFSIKVLPSTETVQVNATQNTQPPIRLQAILQDAPLRLWGLAKRRLPELPIDRLQGTASLQADITLLNGENWIANIENALVNRLEVDAPQWVGNQPARIHQGSVRGKLSMSQGRFLMERGVLDCDLGQLQGDASIPMPLTIPSTTKPWIEGAQYQLVGNVDIAKLINVAPGLIQMRDQTQLLAGKATLSAMQQLTGEQGAHGVYRLQLGDLQANVNGTPMEWKEALTADVDIVQTPQGQARFRANCLAEFCKLEGDGDLAGGKLTSEVDLDKLQQRLSNWFVLPVSQMAGKAQCELNWRQDDGERLQVTGTLLTSPLRIRMASGDLLEPAWNGKFDMIARLPQGTLTQVDRASATLTSTSESLQFALLDPISWETTPTAMQPLPPAGITLKLVGDLGGWQRRAQMFSGVDPGVGLGGRCDLTVKGTADTNHVELMLANWNLKPFTIKGSGFAIHEPEMQGEFKGRFDSRNVANLVVDQLTVQASSFALTAKDAVAETGQGRRGMAAFRVDPSRLMSAIDTGADPNAASTSVQGDVTGRANWTVDTGKLAWQIDVDAKELQVLSLPPRGPGTLASASKTTPNAVVLWTEPIAKAMMLGNYRFDNGELELPNTQLQTEWISYAGKTTLRSDASKMVMQADGQMNYDASRVAERLRPFIGNYATIAGQRTEPVRIVWQSAGSDHWASALQAQTRLGWDTANVIGIDIGKGDVPIVIEDGHLKSKTEIPVSQGVLRWDLDGNIQSMVINQAPEVVLDRVAITPMMCQGWLKFVAPILSEVTRVEGLLSLKVDEAKIVPSDLRQQKFRGELQIHGATVGPGPLTDQLMGIVQQIKSLRKGPTAAAATAGNSWLQMPEQKIEFAVDAGRVIHRNLQIAAGDIVINTSGEVAVDGSLQMTASVPIQKEWIDSTPALASLAGQSLQLPITGTLQNPQVDYRGLGQLTTQMATGVAQGYLQKQLDKGFNKFLGPMQQQLQNIQQGLPIPQGK